MTPAFLHIPKTGGTAIRTAIESASDAGDGNRARYWGHQANLADLAADEVFFVVRDPIERVISAFYSRRRMGRPRYLSPHTPGEAATFRRWPELEPLVHDVAAGDPEALAAWCTVPHLRPLSTWLVNSELIEASNIKYIAELATLNREWPQIRALCGLGDDLELPSSAVASHRAPETPPELSGAARVALRSLLAEDYELYACCQRVRSRRGWG